jgi:protein-S-isoprenylcysteine O-methyltransferase Ste14
VDQIALAASVLCWATIAVAWIGGAIYGAGWNSSDPAGRSAAGSVPFGLTLASVGATAVVVLAGPVVLGPLTIEPAWARFLGLGLLIGSTAFALSARRELGTSWSVMPRVVGDRRLRTTGPYSVTRHPIYSGLLGMLAGTAVLAGGGTWLTLILAGLTVALPKVWLEERLLTRAFPDAYPAYRAAVPQLVPGLRAFRRSRG